jgi:hypothetical protein
MNLPPLKPLHADSALSAAKLEAYRNISTEGLVESLRPGAEGALKVRGDGTIMDGHHRVQVLRERGVDVDSLPRELVLKDHGETLS